MLASKLARRMGGYTLVELLVIISVSSILMLATFAFLTDQYLVIARTDAANDLSINSLSLLRPTVESLRYGDGIRQTNTISDPNAPSGGWNTGNANFVIVIASPAVDSSHNYIIDPSTGSPYMNELVYYKSGNSLLERSLANPSASGNALTTSCPANLANSACPADKDLGDFFSSMNFTLYDQNNNATSDPTQARSIAISLTMQNKLAGNTNTLTNNIRVTLRNRF